jgi:hypothetical protein
VFVSLKPFGWELFLLVNEQMHVKMYGGNTTHISGLQVDNPCSKCLCSWFSIILDILSLNSVQEQECLRLENKINQWHKSLEKLNLKII